MPRPNPSRALGREDHLARTIKRLREQHGMSYAGLARRMADVGCPVQPSALYKIEEATPRRRITIDELFALSRVFELSLEELVALPGELPAQQAEEALRGQFGVVHDWNRIQVTRGRIQNEEHTLAVITSRLEATQSYLVERLRQLDSETTATLLVDVPEPLRESILSELAAGDVPPTHAEGA